MRSTRLIHEKSGWARLSFADVGRVTANDAQQEGITFEFSWRPEDQGRFFNIDHFSTSSSLDYDWWHCDKAHHSHCHHSRTLHFANCNALIFFSSGHHRISGEVAGLFNQKYRELWI